MSFGHRNSPFFGENVWGANTVNITKLGKSRSICRRTSTTLERLTWNDSDIKTSYIWYRIYWYKPMSWGDLFRKFHYILVTIGPKIVFTQKTQTWLIHFNRIPSATEKHLMVFLTYCTSITLKVTGSCGCFVWEFWFMQSHISQCGATEKHYKTMQFKVLAMKMCVQGI